MISKRRPMQTNLKWLQILIKTSAILLKFCQEDTFVLDFQFLKSSCPWRKSFLTFISKTADLYLCQMFFDGACSLKQSLAQYFFYEASYVCAITAAFTTRVTFRQLPTRYQRVSIDHIGNKISESSKSSSTIRF